MANNYECNLKVLSPVYIGSGNDYGASEYVSTKAKNKKGEILKIFKRIDVSKYYLSLNDDEKDEFINDLSTPNFRLADFDSKIPNEYRSYFTYNKCKNNPGPNQDIGEIIKTLNKAYIPGSSIKGAIKTAILYNSVDFEDVKRVLGKINHSPKGSFLGRREYEDFINSQFSSDNFRNAAQSSIMKFLNIFDSSDAKKVSVYDIFSVMATSPSGNKTYVRNRKTVISFLETIDVGNNLKFKLSTNFDKDIYRTLRINDKKHLIDLDYIKESIYKFSKAYINHELEFAEENSISYLEKFYKKREKLNTPDKPMLKIGGGSGFLATTIGLKIKEHDDYNFDDYFEKVRSITKGKSYDYCFPKSRKVTFRGGYPLGWVQLSFN